MGQGQSLRVYRHLEAEIPPLRFNRDCGVAKCISLETSTQSLPTKDPRLSTIIDNGGASPLSNHEQKTSHVSPIGMRNSLHYIVTGSMKQY